MSPFLFLFNFPCTFFSFPVGRAISSEMKVDIKRIYNHSAKLIDLKTNIFGENREPKMVVTEEFDMEIHSTTTQIRFQSQSN
jgi:hypothetical protein